MFEEDIRIVDDTRSERSARSSRPAPRPKPKEEPKAEVKEEREIVRIKEAAPPRRIREEMNINIDLGMNEQRMIPAQPKQKPKELWTEVTKDLVSKEAIEKLGYEFEETEDFYYVMDCLQYVCPFFYRQILLHHTNTQTGGRRRARCRHGRSPPQA